MTATCTGEFEYCIFYPIVTTVRAGSQCADTVTGSSWIGTVTSSATYDSSVTATAAATWTEFPRVYAGGKQACLYAEGGDTDGTLVAQAAYQVPAPAPVYTPPPVFIAPTPTPIPAPVSPPVVRTPTEHLGQNEAIGVTRKWMERKYGHRRTLGNHRRVTCDVRASAAQVGCVAGWIYKRKIYVKSIVVTETADAYILSPNFASAPSQAPSPTPTTTTPTTTAPTGFCATHVCIPNFNNGTGTIVECKDGRWSHSGGEKALAPGTAARRAPQQLPRQEISFRRATWP